MMTGDEAIAACEKEGAQGISLGLAKVLRAERDAEKSRADAMTAELEQVRKERDVHARECDHLDAEREKYRAEADELRKKLSECERAKHNLDCVSGERIAAIEQSLAAAGLREKEWRDLLKEAAAHHEKMMAVIPVTGDILLLQGFSAALSTPVSAYEQRARVMERLREFGEKIASCKFSVAKPEDMKGFKKALSDLRTVK